MIDELRYQYRYILRKTKRILSWWLEDVSTFIVLLVYGCFLILLTFWALEIL